MKATLLKHARYLLIAAPIAMAGCTTLGEADSARIASASTAAEEAKSAAVSAQEQSRQASTAAREAAAAARAASEAAQRAADAANKAAADAAAASDKADRVFQRLLRK